MDQLMVLLVVVLLSFAGADFLCLCSERKRPDGKPDPSPSAARVHGDAGANIAAVLHQHAKSKSSAQQPQPASPPPPSALSLSPALVDEAPSQPADAALTSVLEYDSVHTGAHAADTQQPQTPQPQSPSPAQPPHSFTHPAQADEATRGPESEHAAHTEEKREMKLSGAERNEEAAQAKTWYDALKAVVRDPVLAGNWNDFKEVG